MRLLIAEDEAIIRMDLRETLLDLGHQVVAEARNGAEAVERALSTLPDCVLMDAHMEGDDGIEAAAEISAARICPVVMVTAYSQVEKVRQASHAGVYGYVTKPFSEKDLVAAIEVAAERFRKEEELQGELRQLKDSMEARRAVERAKCMLMESGLTEKEAFTRLRKASMDSRKPLREVAEAVILSRSVSG